MGAAHRVQGLHSRSAKAKGPAAADDGSVHDLWWIARPASVHVCARAHARVFQKRHWLLENKPSLLATQAAGLKE